MFQLSRNADVLAVLLAAIAAAVAWGKTQSDVSWIKKRLDAIEKKLP